MCGTVCVQQLPIFQALQKYPSVSLYKDMIADSSSFVGLRKCACFPPTAFSFYITAALLFSITIVGKMGWNMNKMAYY